MLQQIVAIFMAIIAFFCQLFGIQNPTVSYADYLDLSYGSSPQQVVDISLPKDGGSMPLVVFIHGGSWFAGDEDDYLSQMHNCSGNLKMAAASINYSFISEGGDVTYADMLNDITAALQLIKDTAAEKGVTITKCAIGGDSAGGHLSLLYGYKNASVSPISIGFVFSNSGPTNLADPNFYKGTDSLSAEMACLLMSELSGVDFTVDTLNTPVVQLALLACSPVTYVNAGSVPTLFAHGEKDDMVPVSNAQALDAALTLNGVAHDYFVFPNSGHGLENDADVSAQYNEKLLSYVETYLK